MDDLVRLGHDERDNLHLLLRELTRTLQYRGGAEVLQANSLSVFVVGQFFEGE
jgi:hypothetical protein